MNSSVVLFVVLTTGFALCCSYGVQFGTRLSAGPSVKLYGLSLSSCARRCRCFYGCVYVNYQRRYFLCKLILDTVNRPTYGQAGFVSYNVSSKLNTSVNRNLEDCMSDKVTVCPDITSKAGTTVLGNRHFVGSKIMIECDRAYKLNGSKTATCTAEGLWTERGVCVQNSTMRLPCRSDDNCIDGESECREGQCWCKLGLSHDPASGTCVTTCPGQYGETFQIHKGYRINGINISIYIVKPRTMCMERCLQHKMDNYTCKYVGFLTEGGSKCLLYRIPDNINANEIIITKDANHDLLQRDCS